MAKKRKGRGGMIMDYSKYYDSYLYVLRHPVHCFKNYRLTKKYPFLMPMNRFDNSKPKDYHYQYTEADLIPKGWRKAFGDLLFEDIMNALKKDNINPKDFYFTDIKEKWGSLNMYASNYGENVDHVLEDYRVISEHICMSCGKLDVPLTSFGWVMPLCMRCCEEINKISSKVYKKKACKSKKDCIIPDHQVYTKYKNGQKTKVWHDLTETVNKIREANK